MQSIIVHQTKDYSQDIHFNTPSDWIIHHIPSGYMDREARLEDITQLSTICGASTINNKTIFFGGNDIHFDDHTISYMED